MQQEINRIVAVFGQESIGMAVSVFVALCGVAGVVLRFIIKVVRDKNVDAIEQVFMNRTQRTNLKILDFFIIFIAMWGLNIYLALTSDRIVHITLGIIFYAALFLILIYGIYRAAYYIWSKQNKSEKRWKCHNTMEIMLLMSEFLIGAESGKLMFDQSTLNLLQVVLVCLFTAFVTTLLLITTGGFLKERPSRVYFDGKKGTRTYIYYKLDHDFLVCGDDRDFQKANIRLIALESLKKYNHSLVVEDLDAPENFVRE